MGTSALALSGGRAMMSVCNLHGSYVQERNDHPAVGIWKGDEDRAFQECGLCAAVNRESFSAGCPDEERFKRVL